MAVAVAGVLPLPVVVVVVRGQQTVLRLARPLARQKQTSFVADLLRRVLVGVAVEVLVVGDVVELLVLQGVELLVLQGVELLVQQGMERLLLGRLHLVTLRSLS